MKTYTFRFNDLKFFNKYILVVRDGEEEMFEKIEGVDFSVNFDEFSSREDIDEFLKKLRKNAFFHHPWIVVDNINRFLSNLVKCSSYIKREFGINQYTYLIRSLMDIVDHEYSLIKYFRKEDNSDVVDSRA